MTNHGFIDPSEPMRQRMERLEALVTEALSQLSITDLSPEAQAILADLESADQRRRELAQRHIQRLMDADPLDAEEGKVARLALPDIEVVAARVHEAWMESKKAQGVTSRPSEWGEEQMVPYADLTERAKDLDRSTVRAVYDALTAEGAS